MNGSRRGVGVFMAIGLAIAVIVGFAVWGASSPGRSSTAGYAAGTTTVEQTTAPKSSRSSAAADSKDREAASSTSRSGSGRSTLALTSQTLAGSGLPLDTGVYGIEGEALLDNAPARPNPNYRMESDPYAPPLAVTSAPKSTPPTAIYRPTNVVPQTPGGDNTTGPAPGQTPDTNGVTTPPSGPANNVETSAPAEPGTTTAPNQNPAAPDADAPNSVAPKEQAERPRPDAETRNDVRGDVGRGEANRTESGRDPVVDAGREPAGEAAREPAAPAVVEPTVAGTPRLDMAPEPQAEPAPQG